MNRLVLAAVALGSIPSVSAAQDLFVYGGAELQFAIEPDGAGSGNKVDLNGYVEVETRGFYAGIWAEVSNQSVANEVNLYLGYRGAFASGATWDVGYTRYIYPRDGGDCCGELTLALGTSLSEQVAVTLDVAYDPQAKLANAYLGAEFYASDTITLSANYGIYEVDGAGSEREWDLGVGYALGEETAVELRWYDGTDYVDGYVGMNLIWDTTLLER